MQSVPFKSVISWGITIIIAVIGGTFSVTQYISDQNTETLKARIGIEKQKRIEAERIAKEIKANPYATVIPAKQIAENANNPEIYKLASRIESLEVEKRNLIEELSNKSVSSLDPRSELSGLILLLNSENSEERGKAIDSLFKIRDQVSFEPLVKYFLNYPNEITSGYNPNIGAWYEFFIDTNEPSGIEFVVQQFENSYRFHSYVAYSILEREIKTVPRIEMAIPHLKDVALRSNNTFARSYAKILLEILNQRKDQIISDQKERHRYLNNNKSSTYQLVEEIHQKIVGSESKVLLNINIPDRDGNIGKVQSSVTCEPIAPGED